MLIQQQMENPFGCPVLCLSMGGHLTGSSEAAQLSSTGEPLSVAEATSGKYRILFMHPEASITDSGQRLLREMSSKEVIHGLFVDEVHQGLEGHWASIRPGLLRNILAVKIHMVKHAPICILTATITPDELSTVKKLMGRRKAPLLVADGPIGGHTKICTIRRPSSDVDFLGRTLVNGSRQPGILELLRFLALDKFLEALRTGQNFPRTIIFFRCLILHFSCCCRGLENLIFHRS